MKNNIICANIVSIIDLLKKDVKLKIIVNGCGKVGKTMIESLTLEGHDVVAIDTDTAVLSEISNMYDIACINGNGADSDILIESGISDAELFVSVAGSDELNMLSCFLAKKLGAAHTIARIRTPDYNDKSLATIRQQFDLSMAINPELLAAHEIFNILQLPSAVNVETFSRRNFEMVELRIKEGSGLDGLSLLDFRKKYSANFIVCAVKRDNKGYIPDGKFVLKAGDRIGISATPNEILKLLKSLGMFKKQAKKILILGASRTAYYLAKMLASIGSDVKIIDKSQARCVDFAKRLENVAIIHGNGTNQELLSEEGLDVIDAFVGLTGMDEENILLAFYAASHNVPKNIAKVNNIELASMAEKLGLESIISPQNIVTNIILSYARALQNSIGSNVETLYKLMDGSVEALEFNVTDNFEFLKIPLKNMNLRKNTLIAGIIRGRKAIIPTGEDYILPNDKVIVIAADRRAYDLSDIIERQ